MTYPSPSAMLSLLALDLGDRSAVAAGNLTVVIEDGRAVGVEVARGGRVEVIWAGREVIVAASSINTPKLLMLSGIGAAGGRD